MVVLNLVVGNFYAEALFCALLRPFALLRLRSFALFLRAFACFCKRPRLQRPRLGTADLLYKFSGTLLGMRCVQVWHSFLWHMACCQNLRCFFAPPSMRNGRSQFSVISNGFPPDSCRISIDFLSFSISFSQLQSILISSNQFQSV